MRAEACVTTAASTALAVFRPDWVPGQISSKCWIRDSQAGLELLTPDVVALCVSSGDEYRATLDDGSSGRVYPLPGVIRTRDAAVRLTSATSYEPEVVETRTVITRLFLSSLAVRDR